MMAIPMHADWFSGARYLHVTGITPALEPETGEATLRAMHMARDMGLIISFDPNLRLKLWGEETARSVLMSMIPLCDLFLPGEGEAEDLVGLLESPPGLLGRLGPGAAHADLLRSLAGENKRIVGSC